MKSDERKERVQKQKQEHQLKAYHSAVQVIKIRDSQKPSYHYDRLFISRAPRSLATETSRIEFDLYLARNSFFHQASRIWKLLPQTVKLSSKLGWFKTLNMDWIKRNIAVRP